MYYKIIMNIGLDIHGTADRYPSLFLELSEEWRSRGNTIHILTGEAWETASEQIYSLDIAFDHYFSITDWARDQGIPVEDTDSGPWMAPDSWNSAKGIYCRKHGLDIHFDDDVSYSEAMPSTCTFVLVGDNFDNVWKRLNGPIVQRQNRVL